MVKPTMHRDNRPAIPYSNGHNTHFRMVICIILDEYSNTYWKQSLDKLPGNQRFIHQIKDDANIPRPKNSDDGMNWDITFSRRNKNRISIAQLCRVFRVVVDANIYAVGITQCASKGKPDLR